MIQFIKGIIFSIDEEDILIEVGGIGYHVFVPSRIFPQDKEAGDEILLYTYLQIREDQWQLFGFPQKEQMEVFRLLISVSGIGPKLGQAILNHFSYQEVISYILAGDSKGLSQAPGVGKKTGERLVLELREKFKKLDDGKETSNNLSPGQDTALNQDCVLALTQLGYSAPEARSACMRTSNALGPEADTQDLIKGALKLLGKF
ncbi:Holliday junction branch migration protein RuvA [Dehalobacterium formicoaceticum]|uniref:Holliday junction branch migration complex subunit RuvA n=1 Tax=Dehalobacterium formicoaceticum TaxID=51515 RepID=A0ABT1Y7E4_9FIRM|nr:Holliday junction branch migration protein RuvA [Dehalobacterium formicoaceticum]MCR6546809.1 Holliday junction branch migration protein RuvA [Dehalobacterium formicoaceticum]